MKARRASRHGRDRVGLADVRVDAVMSRRMLRCPPEASLREVADLMATEGIHCVVVDELREEDGGVGGWGVISDLDLVVAAPGEVDDLTAAEIAATEPVMVSVSDSLDRVAQQMAEHQVAHVLVVAGDPARPAGVVSTLDLARALSAPPVEEEPTPPVDRPTPPAASSS